MPVFSSAETANAHKQFIEWVETHPNGFFINRKSSTNMMIHATKCGHLKPYDWANQTSNVKACSVSRLKLEHWAEVEGVSELKVCNDCL
ncbi:MAG TPA: hypothetical protein VFD48_13490 [Pyrinomonadaceae bacterium]|nr:hypothetical protein [Pyrinomonadaceae bacterium]